jgi:proline dehydrogenase
MGLMRRSLLVASQSQWLRERAPRFAFIRRTVTRFMPGESVDEALRAAARLAESRIATVLTHLGENIADRAEAEGVARHYLDLNERIRAAQLPAEISIKLTQLGLDLDPEFCFAHLATLAERTPPDKMLWIDMEQSPYVDVTLDLYRRARERYPNVGVCVQAYLYRTVKDIEKLISIGACIRLVKGAYNEPAELAFPKKSDVDNNYFQLTKMLLSAAARGAGVRAAIATHDRVLIESICQWAAAQGNPKEELEFQMLYGIQRAEQMRLAGQGYRMAVLISYGSYWFPWFMRRLAERPANMLFLARNFYSG